MMGRLKNDQGQLFYEFHLGDAVPEDHLVRKIDAALDLSWLRGELAPHYSTMGRPSIDPALMIRMQSLHGNGRHPGQFHRFRQAEGSSRRLVYARYNQRPRRGMTVLLAVAVCSA